ncbi:MAG: HD domain-containing protein, partial [Gammaproteobacteria bacterium]|nr:HD domain-containing protein [Gammaproteobacteria bacterium]
MFSFYALQKKLAAYLTEQQIASIVRAFLFAANAHDEQFRSSGEPYVTHTVATACTLADMHLDPETIMAALMHDVIEDTAYTFENVSQEFGVKVAELVNGVSKLTQIKFESKAEAQAENFRKMMLAMTEDIRVILIKMADRLHNMSTLDSLTPQKRYRIALETMEIYVPIAHRLGMNQFKVQLEDYGLKAMHPWRYKILEKHVNQARGHRKHLLEKIENTLIKNLAKFGITPSQIIGREKSLTSIYRKMRDRGVPFSEIMDIFGFRIIAATVFDCYHILGAIHSVFKPIPGKFKDYIAIPKTNGYQSLHTLLFGPYGVPIEMQIRTREMHQIAENGIAAHWLYKVQTAQGGIQSKTTAWLKNVADIEGH